MMDFKTTYAPYLLRCFMLWSDSTCSPTVLYEVTQQKLIFPNRPSNQRLQLHKQAFDNSNCRWTTTPYRVSTSSSPAAASAARRKTATPWCWAPPTPWPPWPRPRRRWLATTRSRPCWSGCSLKKSRGLEPRPTHRQTVVRATFVY